MYRLVLATLVFLTQTEVGQADQVFSCSGAEVRIEVVRTGEYSVDSVVTAKKGDTSTVLRHSNIDYIGGVCTKSASGKSLVLYQAHCGGSGCKDLDNWGILDPEDLRVLLAPSDANRNRAVAILGRPPQVSNKISIEREKSRLGVKLL